MVRFGSKKIKRFKVSNRVFSSARGKKISVVSPGLRRIKRTGNSSGLIPTPQDPR